jgi:hypothetical protein
MPALMNAVHKGDLKVAASVFADDFQLNDAIPEPITSRKNAFPDLD